MIGIDKETFHVPCENYGCHNRAEYKIGHLGGPPSEMYRVCKNCLILINEGLEKIFPNVSIEEDEEVIEEVIEEVKEVEVIEEVKEEVIEEVKEVEVIEEVKENKKKVKK